MMHFSPLQSLFDHSFYAVTDLVYLALNAYAATIVNRGQWRMHLNWLVPFVVQGILTIVYRSIVSAHYFFGMLMSPELYFFGVNCLYIADIVGVIGNVILCRTLKQMVSSAAAAPPQPADAAHLGPDQTTWPPPPQERR